MLYPTEYFLFSFLFFFSFFPFPLMEYLVSSRGLDLDKRPSELEKDLGSIRASTLANVREALFEEAKSSNLMAVGSLPVQRRKTNGGKT